MYLRYNVKNVSNEIENKGVSCMNQPQVKDTYMRPLRDLRISVTDRCNFRCSYCMPAELFGNDYPFLEKSHLLTFTEIERLVHIFQKLGVKKIRITGGEPLMRKDLHQLIGKVKQIEGIHDVAMTTNGSFLKKHTAQLVQQGLDRVTVSLDSLDNDRFAQMNGIAYTVQPILDGIEAAQQAGLSIKINMVVKKGVNDDDILPMAEYCKARGYTLRFIEFMDVGNTNDWKLEQVVSSEDIKQLIDEKMPLVAVEANYLGEVASRYRYKDNSTEIGFISSVTQPFCTTCTRARISAEGLLYTCLFASEGYDLKTPLRSGAGDDELEQIIRNIWASRDDRYSETRKDDSPQQRKVEMSYIGG